MGDLFFFCVLKYLALLKKKELDSANVENSTHDLNLPALFFELHPTVDGNQMAIQYRWGSLCMKDYLLNNEARAPMPMGSYFAIQSL